MRAEDYRTGYSALMRYSSPTGRNSNRGCSEGRSRLAVPSSRVKRRAERDARAIRRVVLALLNLGGSSGFAWVHSALCPNGGEPGLMLSLNPDSGIQLLMILGAVFILASRPDLGMMLLSLGIGGWLVYNALNIPRQF